MVRMLAVICSLLLVGAAAPVTAQAPVASLTLDEAVSLARAANPTVRAKEVEVQAVGANEITAALRPNPIATFLAEQFGSGNVAVTQYTFNVGQPIELGGKRQRRVAAGCGAVGELACPEVTKSKSELYRMALDARPELRVAQAAREKASADINLAKANAWWDVTPQIEYQRIGPDNTIGFGFN